MTALELIVALAGVGITALVVVGMILITPRGVVDVDPDGPDLAARDEAAAEHAAAVTTRA